MFIEKLTKKEKFNLLCKAYAIWENLPNSQDYVSELIKESKKETMQSEDKSLLETYTINKFNDIECIYISDFSLFITADNVSYSAGEKVSKMYYQYMCKKFPNYAESYFNDRKASIDKEYNAKIKNLKNDISELSKPDNGMEQ